MEKGLSQITREEWVTYQWIDVTQMGDEERIFMRHYKRTPDEMAQAMMDWEETEEFRQVIQ